MIPVNGVNGVNGHRVRQLVMEVRGTDTGPAIHHHLSTEPNFVRYVI